MDNVSAERILDESKRRSVPGLHPGLNDLIRVLGKQAHCASRTLILCEPHVPSRTRKTNYHKHCSPKRRSSAETVVRKPALWSPIRPDNYFYDCFSYTHYPERETDYLDIQKRYSALKNKYLTYSAPVCDENRIRRSLESPAIKHKWRTNHLIGAHPDSTKTKTDIPYFLSSTSQSPIKLMTSSEIMNLNNQSQIQAYSSHEVNEPVTPPVSTANKAIRDHGESKSNSVPCAELIDLQNLIRKNDRENFERMQQMLTLMKELSSKDFCRATCDQVMERFDEMDTGKWKERGGNAVPPKVPVAKEPKPAAAKSKKTTESKKSVISKPDDLESSDTERDSDYLTESSTSSVTSSSGRSGHLHPVKSKSSTKVLESYSEESVEQDFIPFWHDEQEEGTSEIEESYEERESSASLVNDADLADVSAGSVDKPVVAAGIASPQSVARLPVKMEANSTDSTRDSDDPSTESVDSTKKLEDIIPQDTHLIDEFNIEQVESVERDDSQPDPDRTKNPLLTIGDSPMTVHELVEVSNIITDIVVLETVNELMKNGIYTPPSRRQGGHSITSPSMISEGTSEPPFQVQKYPKSIMSDSKDRIKELKSVSLPRASALESYKDASKGEHELQPTPSKTSGTAKGVKEPSPGDTTSQVESLTSRGSKTPDVLKTPSKTSGISKSAPRKSKMDGSKEAPPNDLTTQRETVTSRGSREPGVPTTPSKTSGISKSAPRKSKMDGSKEAPPDDLTTQRETVTSRGSREPDAPTTPSKTSGISKSAPRKSKMDGSIEAPPDDLTTQRETVTSRGSREPDAPTTPSKTSGISKGAPRKSKMDGSKEAPPNDLTTQRDSVTSRGSPEPGVPTTPSKTSGISKGAPRKSKMDGSKEAPPNALATQRDSVTSRGSQEPGVPTTPSKTSGIAKGAPRKSKMDGSKEAPLNDLTTQRDSVTSRGSRKPGERTTPSKTSGVSDRSKDDSMKLNGSECSSKSDIDEESSGESMECMSSEGSNIEADRSNLEDEPGSESIKSKVEGASEVGSMLSRIDEESTTSRSGDTSKISSKKSRVSDQSRVGSKKSKGSDYSNIDSHKPKVSRVSISEETKAESMKDKQGSMNSKASEGSKIGADRSNLDGEPRFESMKSKGADASEVESMLPSIDEESTISRSGDTSKISSKKSGVSDQSRVGSKKSKGSDYANIDFHKPSAEPVQSKTSLKRKSIEERIEPSKVSHVSGGSNQSEKSARVGHTRTSSCRSPSPSSDRGSLRADKSYISPVTSDRDKSKDVTSSSSVRSHKERRKLSGEITKLSTIGSICERDDSLTCFDYEKDNTVLYYVRITENAYPPEKETYRAAGFMLKSAYDYTIPPRGKVNVKTDLMLELPPNSYGRIAPVKCLAINFGIDVGADVINRDYRENVTVLLFNHSDRSFSIKKGNKVAQLICESIHQAAAKEKCDLLNSV